jgi:hypothetical protein
MLITQNLNDKLNEPGALFFTVTEPARLASRISNPSSPQTFSRRTASPLTRSESSFSSGSRQKILESGERKILESIKRKILESIWREKNPLHSTAASSS